MRRFTLSVLGTIATFLGSPSAAQDEPPSDQAPIIVEGRRDREAEIRELVDALPPAPMTGHIIRFEHLACPAVLGVPDEQKALVVDRMRAVADAAGVPLDRPGCRANVLVLVTNDKRQLMEHLWRRYGYFFGERTNRQIERLVQSEAPAVLWQLNGQVDASGRELFSTMGGTIVNRTTQRPSRISDQAHAVLTGSILVVDSSALAGLSTTQFADYAALRLFSGVDPARLTTPNLSTILTALEAPMGSEVPLTLTNWDLAFLHALYASNESIHAPAQRGEIRDGMRREIERVEGAEQP